MYINRALFAYIRQRKQPLALLLCSSIEEEETFLSFEEDLSEKAAGPHPFSVSQLSPISLLLVRYEILLNNISAAVNCGGCQKGTRTRRSCTYCSWRRRRWAFSFSPAIYILLHRQARVGKAKTTRKGAKDFSFQYCTLKQAGCEERSEKGGPH